MTKTNFTMTALTAAFIFIGSLVVSPAYADGNCQPIYGGGETCVTTQNIVINKTVQNPGNNSFVDNLGVNDPKFQPGSQITFQLTVTNTGNTTLGTVTVKDVFPQHVDFAAGPDGSKFDNNTRTLSFTVSDLKAGESRTYNVVGRVVPEAKLPSDQGTTCDINQATASIDNKTSQDNAQFCIQKQVLAAQVPTTTKGGLKVFSAPSVTTTPSTGPEMLPLLGLIPSGIAGLFLRKKARA